MYAQNYKKLSQFSFREFLKISKKIVNPQFFLLLCYRRENAQRLSNIKSF